MKSVAFTFGIAFALLTATIVAVAQDSPRRDLTCEILQPDFPWVECDGNHFAPVQCMEENDECFCVDPMTGIRIGHRRNRAREDINCDDAELPDEEDHYDYDYDYEYDEAEHCPDHDQMVLICSGRNCIREPSPHEDCLQCIDNCNDTLVVIFDDECHTTADCPDNGTCTAVGFFGQKECVEFIRDGEVCLPEENHGNGLDFDDEFVFENPHDEDYDYENDYDYFDDFGFDEDDEDIYYTILYLVDSSMQFDGKRCAPHQLCKKYNGTLHTCQNKTGPCYQHNHRPIQAPQRPGPHPALECNIDGTYKTSQIDYIEQWCVFPGNGSEIPNTRTNIERELPVYCDELVYSKCPVMIEFNGYEYAIDHGDKGMRVIGLNCSHCYCNDGQFEDCYSVPCPYGFDPDSIHSCVVNGTTYYHHETFDDDCNMCICVNGSVVCTNLVCEDDESDNSVEACHNTVHEPVCGINLRTYPNLCAAQVAGLNQLEVLQGACTRESICALHPCEQGYRCFPLATACSSEISCSADDFRKCINTTMLKCPVTNGTSSQVCGLNGRTYQSVCQLLQLSNTQVRFPGSCNRSDCRNSTNSMVCGTDGITYRTRCDLKTRPNVRVDYRGRCLNSRPTETVSAYCARVRRTGRCTNRTNCTVIALPSDGCCPICGGGVSVAYDKHGLDRYDDVVSEAKTTKGIRRIMRKSAIVRDQSNKCLLEVEFTSNGDLELLYIAKNDSDAFTCAAIAANVARYINNLRTSSTRRRRRQAEDPSAVDPIFNYMTIASPLEQEMLNGTMGDGGDEASINSGVVVFSAPNRTLIFIFAFVLLKLIMD